MDSIRRKFYEGLVTIEEYRGKAIRSTISILNDNGFDYVKELGSGSFGTVIEVLHPVHGNLAAKIVLKECSSDSEMQIWPDLYHENLLPLIKTIEISSTYTTVFFMPVYPAALSEIVEHAMFSSYEDDFEKIIFCLQGIAQGVEHLHRQKLCHLDLKMNNVLLSDIDMPVITDFGSLTYTESGTNSYASPFIFRPPEAFIKDGKRVVVDGFKYDVYTFGLLAVELFTKLSITKAVYKSSLSDPDPKWTDVMYARIFDIVKKKKFESLVSCTFRNSKIESNTLKALHNLILGCINLNPRRRPSMSEILQHRLFGGSNVFVVRENDVWNKRASGNKISFLLSLFIALAANLSCPSESSDTASVHSLQKDGGDVLHHSKGNSKELANENRFKPSNQRKTKMSSISVINLAQIHKILILLVLYHLRKRNPKISVWSRKLCIAKLEKSHTFEDSLIASFQC